MTVTLTPEREAELLAEYHARTARIHAELAEPDQARAHFKQVMAKRNAPRMVEVRDPRQCSICDDTIPQHTHAYYSPGRIAAKSSRNSDAVFTSGRWVCLKCMEALQK